MLPVGPGLAFSCRRLPPGGDGAQDLLCDSPYGSALRCSDSFTTASLQNSERAPGFFPRTINYYGTKLKEQAYAQYHADWGRTVIFDVSGHLIGTIQKTDSTTEPYFRNPSQKILPDDFQVDLLPPNLKYFKNEDWAFKRLINAALNFYNMRFLGIEDIFHEKYVFLNKDGALFARGTCDKLGDGCEVRDVNTNAILATYRRESLPRSNHYEIRVEDPKKFDPRFLLFLNLGSLSDRYQYN